MYCRVLAESHESAATIYIAGLLMDAAAEQTESFVSALENQIRVVRLDLRAVDLIDPASFVRVARALNQWRDVRRGRVTIEFPARSRRATKPALQLVDQRNDQRSEQRGDQRSTIGTAVSTAISSPMSTSPG